MGKGEVSELEQHIGYWLRFVSNHVSHAFKQKVEAEGVTVAEWAVMRRMFDAGSVHPSQLAERMGMTRGAVSKLLDRLCQKNLAVRESADDDRRYQTVELTRAGKRLVPILARLADANDREFFGHLRPQEREQVVSLLQAIVEKHNWIELPTN
jgi:DNA-binding MarR family transcriptional regulator